MQHWLCQALAEGRYILQHMLKMNGKLQLPVFLGAQACAAGLGDAVSCSTQPPAPWRICLCSWSDEMVQGEHMFSKCPCSPLAGAVL